MNKTYILFDIDGTLIESGGAGKKAMMMSFTECLESAHGLDNFSFAGQVDYRILKHFVSKVYVDPVKTEEVINKIKDRYIEYLSVTLKEAPAYKVYPHAKELLSALDKNEQYELGLMTGNIREGARLKLEHGSIWKYFKWGVFGDHVEERTVLADNALKEISKREEKIDPGKIYIIGDTPFDIRCGKSIGAATVAYISKKEFLKEIEALNPDHILYDYKDFINILER
ncbi:HAD family hydrolase [Spirochaetota bacterium]